MNTTSRRALLGAAGALALGIPLSGVAALAAFADPDTEAPASTFHVGAAPASGWHRSPVPVRVTATDAGGSGVASIEYRMGDGPVVSTGLADVSLTITAEGVTPLTAWAVDAAGNAETPHTLTARIDRTAPVIRVDTPTRVRVGEAATFEVTCEDATSGLATCESNVADGTPLPTDVAGEHRITVSATDVAGNLASTEFVYEVVPDADGPAVSYLVDPEPASGWYTAPVAVGVQTTDPSGVASVHWATSGPVSESGDVVGEESTTVVLDADGVTSLTSWAFDTFGNRSADATATIRIDTVGPVVAERQHDIAAASTTPEYALGTRVELAPACVDATSGVAECGVAGSVDGTIDTSTAGVHTAVLYGVDVAGNRTELAYEYRVVAPGGGSGGGSGGGGSGGGDGGSDGGGDGGSGGGPKPAVGGSGTTPPVLASTGLDAAGLAMIAGLVAGAGAALVGVPRLVRR